MTIMTVFFVDPVEFSRGFHMIPAYVHRHLSSPTSCNSAVIEVKSYPGECPFKGLLTKTYGCGSFHPSLNLNNRDV